MREKFERKRDRWCEMELRRQLRLHGLCPLLWYIHFEGVFPEEAVCGDCLDFQLGFCKGEALPEACRLPVQLRFQKVVLVKGFEERERESGDSLCLARGPKVKR